MLQDQDATRVAPRADAGAAALVGTILADRYRIVTLLGEGAQGAVYIGEHLKIGRRDAIKVLRPELLADADAVARFARGASKACQISHPNVCTVYDFGETAAGLPFMASQLVDGCELQQLMEEQAPFPLARAVDLVTQVAAGLQAAHELEIVHRDLKPANVMVQSAKDGRDVVKVVDFDIAKGIGESEVSGVTQIGWIVGTPRYMSPEQMTGGELDGRSDIYSLALMFFEMLTGALPNASTTTQRMMWERVNGEMQSLAEVVPHLVYPARLQAVLDRALASDPDHRPATAGEFAREILDALDESQPVDGAGVAGDTTVLLEAEQRRSTTQPARRSGVRLRQTGAAAPAAPEPAAKSGTAGVATGPRRSLRARSLVGAAALIVIIAAGSIAIMGGGTEPVPSLAVPEQVELGVGAGRNLNIRLLDAGTGEPLVGAIEYQAMEPAVATVDAAGMLRGVTAGSTSILVRAAGLTRQVSVSVTPAADADAAPLQSGPPAVSTSAGPPAQPRQDPVRVTTPPAGTAAAAEPASVPVPAHLSEALVLGNIHLDGARFQQAETVVADALSELGPLLLRHPGHTGLLDLRRQLGTLQQENRSACRAIAGVTGGACPGGGA